MNNKELIEIPVLLEYLLWGFRYKYSDTNSS